MKRLVIALLIVAVLAGGGYFGYWYYQKVQADNALASLQTVRVERGTLTATIGGTGVVRSNQTALMGWKTSGTLEKINVEVGSAVKTGDVLASLKESSLSAAIIQAQTELTTAKKALDDLQNSSSSQKQAWLNVTNAQKAVIEAKKRLDAIDTSDYQKKLDDAQVKITDADTVLKDAQDAFDNAKDLAVDNPTRKDADTKLKDAQLKYNDAVRALDVLKLDLEQAKINVQLAESLLADAQREYDRLKNGPDPDDIAALKARIAAAESTLSLSHLDAPFNGSITDIKSKEGDQVNVGTVSFRVDDLSRLLIDVEIPEVDINRIEHGMSATLTFDAILDKEYTGKVTEVSEVGVSSQGVINFLVTIELLDADKDVRPGMTAAVSIAVKQVDKALLVPNRAVRTRDGKRIIYLLRSGSQQMVEIKIGTFSDTYSEILSGDVAEGDSVILNPAPEWNMTGPPAGMGR